MNKCIYLAWQDQATRGWHVIGKLFRINKIYEFRYTQGIHKIANFSLLPSMPNHEEVYRSTELFSLFKNRLMPKSRPDYPNYIRWMGLNEDHVDELDTLAISGGEKETDYFRIIPVPEKTSNEEYSFNFFINGISHMPDETKELINHLHKGDKLYLLHDFQNEYDKHALLLRTNNPSSLVGYIPAYLTKIICNIQSEKGPESMRVNVVQVNSDAPFQKRLLCKLTFSSLTKSWDKYEEEFETFAA